MCGCFLWCRVAERLPEASAGFGLLFTLTSGNVPPARARAAANACRQGAARRLACRGRTARFPGCCRAAGRHRGHPAPSLHRCGYRPRRAACGHPRRSFLIFLNANRKQLPSLRGRLSSLLSSLTSVSATLRETFRDTRAARSHLDRDTVSCEVLLGLGDLGQAEPG